MRIRYSHLLALAALFASVGNSAVHIAIPWLVLETTGSSANAGVVLGISGFSVIFTAPIIGGLIAVLGPDQFLFGPTSSQQVPFCCSPLLEL